MLKNKPMKTRPSLGILVALLFSLPSLAQQTYQPISVLNVEIDTIPVSFPEQEQFKNDVTGNTVKVLHAVENTGFQFYNSVSFRNDKEGIIAGGTRLRLRSTQDGGKHWKGFSFSGFANAFYSTAIYENQFYVVGASRYIFRNDDLNTEWEAFDVNTLGESKYALRHPKFYKIKFSPSGFGIIVGDNNGKPLVLKTTDKGAHWKKVKLNGLQTDEVSLSDVFIFPDDTIRLLSFTGNVYESSNEGKDWSLLRRGKEGESLNSIAFATKKEGYIAGLQGLLLKTTDGGKTWEQIDTTVLGSGANISNLEYTKDHRLLLTTAESFQDEKNNAPIFSIDKEGKISPFLSAKGQTFVFDAYGLFLLNDNVFLLDRDKLYKIKV